MRVLLTGASGQLGQELLPRLQALGEVVQVDRAVGGDDRRTLQQDLADLDRVELLLNSARPDLVVNAAAYTEVDRAEQDSAAAFRINSDLPGCLARWSQRNGCLLVHYSTDYVFSGESDRPWRESDPTGPLNVYGQSKLAGERAIAESGCRHLVLRTSWVYSGHGSNFVLTMLRLARERPALSIVADQVGCPTWARNLAQVTERLISAVGENPGRLGTWHYCDSGILSWYDFAQAIFAAAQSAGLLERLPKTTAVPSSGFPQAARRPLYSVLDTSAIRREFGIEPAGFASSLRSCIEEMKRA